MVSLRSSLSQRVNVPKGSDRKFRYTLNSPRLLEGVLDNEASIGCSLFMFPISRHRLIPAFAFVVLAVLAACPTFAQNQSEVRQAFVDIRDDHVRNNCCRATYWLYINREKLRNQILEELYRTNDAQARDALLSVLLLWDTYNPDERFARLLLQRLHTGDPKLFVGLPKDAPEDAKAKFNSKGDPVWVFIDAHYAFFEPLLKAEIANADSSMFELWSIAWLMKKRGALAENSELFTENVLRRAGSNLKDDSEGYNASQAARLFLLFPKKSLPVLAELSQSTDIQQRSLARALTDAISKGSKDAFGFICSKCTLSYVLFGEPVPEPDWLADLVARNVETNRETYP
jgi:hypothetical protein